MAAVGSPVTQAPVKKHSRPCCPVAMNSSASGTPC
eukprot:CAMPEP_0181494502 /NCGR_PEP_ID=MMETSP1110-20121109/51803_1 /TAXON_ID=174948 /ORGANISM="Symbiodinium sp., Strain CCMP421" /LENGTH=34 /DNA_ID= /DNA_START= /DNA_END= /DNA_ORIENTATION=